MVATPAGGSGDDGSGQDGSVEDGRARDAGRLLPLFPLATVLVPGMPLSLHIFEPRYRQLIADLLKSGPVEQAAFGVVALRRGWEVGAIGDLYDVGTCARVVGLRPHPDGRYDLAAIGTDRFAIDSLDTTSRPYVVGRVRYLVDPDESPSPDSGPAGAADAAPDEMRFAARAAAARASCDTYLSALSELTENDVSLALPESDDAQELSYAVARLPSLGLADRQALLSCPSTAARLDLGRRILRREAILLNRLQAVPAGASHFRDQSTLS